MSEKEFFAIGHITNDTLPKPHVGGGVSYTAFAAKRLGYEAHIITKAPEDSQFVRELQALGIIVHCLPIVDGANAEKVTAFANVNDAIGRRTQYVSQVQENIGMEDLPQFPNIPDSALVMVAPVIGEVTPEALVALGRQRQIAVTPQGYYRVAEADGSVRRADWKDAEVLRNSWISVLSSEDLSFGHPPQLNVSVREKLQSLAPLLAITDGENGSELSLAGRKNRIHIEALSLKREELRDFTGAGDTYAFAFLAKFAETRDAVDAGVFASLFAALKIADIAEGGNGLATVPDHAVVRQFVRNNPKRMRDFFASNGSTEQKMF